MRIWWKEKPLVLFGEVQMVQPLWKTVWRLLNKPKIDLACDPEIPLLGTHQKQKHRFEEIHAPQCSWQNYLQFPRYGGSISVHQQMMGKDMVCMHTYMIGVCVCVCYSAIKNNEMFPSAAKWVDLEGIRLSEISQTEKDRYCVTSLICGI